MTIRILADNQSRQGCFFFSSTITKDSNKGTTNISWNSLNLPNVVSFSNGSTVTYTYAADGTKLRTVHSINGTTTQKDYCGSAIYENGVAELWQTEAGYISMDDSKYHYYLQDHQGNNRVVVSETGAAEEVNHYYALGGLFASTGNVQPYKYNGKELDTNKGLNWYDYGARQYDATLGRWFAVDPLAEKDYLNSPYNYCANNPLKYADPTGAMKVIYNPDGTYKETTHNYWFHNTFMGRQEYIDYGDKMTRLSEEEFWQWQITGNWGSIKPADNLTTFEFWLDSTSDNIMDGIIKFLISEVYSFPNSIKSILTGKTIGGTLLTPIEKQEKFIDLVESLSASKFIKFAHPGTSKDFFKKNPTGYFTKKKYTEKVNNYKEFSKNKKSYNMIMDYYVNLLNKLEKENEESNY